MKKACIMFTGQLRTFDLCYMNILENIINPNIDNISFDIYILADYLSKDISTFTQDISNKYSLNSVNLVYTEDSSNIVYPDFLKDMTGPCMCLFKNKVLFDRIYNNNEYDIFIRLRPDIKLTNIINLNNIDINRKINIISSITTRQDCPCILGDAHIHDRDWDYMLITDTEGMKLWCDFFNFLEQNYEYDFSEEIKFNNNGYWVKDLNNYNNKYVIPIQAFFKNIKTHNYNVEFDSGQCYAYICRG